MNCGVSFFFLLHFEGEKKTNALHALLFFEDTPSSFYMQKEKNNKRSRKPLI